MESSVSTVSGIAALSRAPLKQRPNYCNQALWIHVRIAAFSSFAVGIEDC